MTGKNAENKNSAAIKRIRRIILRVLKCSEGFRKPLTEVLELLDELDEQLESSAGQSRSRSSKATSARTRYQPKEYTVEQRRREQCLCEYRIGGRSQPFCCPRDVYEAIVEVLASNNDWIQFDDIRARAGENLDAIVPEYLPRVCLRFWQSTTPPIVEKNRTRYRSCASGSFKSAARRAWRELEEAQDK